MTPLQAMADAIRKELAVYEGIPHSTPKAAYDWCALAALRALGGNVSEEMKRAAWDAQWMSEDDMACAIAAALRAAEGDTHALHPSPHLTIT